LPSGSNTRSWSNVEVAAREPPRRRAGIVLVAGVELVEQVVEPEVAPVDVLRAEAQAVVVVPERGQRLARVPTKAIRGIREPGAPIEEQVVLERAGLDRVERMAIRLGRVVAAVDMRTGRGAAIAHVLVQARELVAEADEHRAAVARVDPGSGERAVEAPAGIQRQLAVPARERHPVLDQVVVGGRGVVEPPMLMRRAPAALARSEVELLPRRRAERGHVHGARDRRDR
jgi:hypothetical protein